jgi:HAD superfamily hydrolase (TIGR01450 family)
MSDPSRERTTSEGRAAAQPLLAAYDGVICDLDGVVYRGHEPVAGAPTALQDMVARGIRVVYATNNASRVPGDVAEQVAALGAPASEADIVTSAQAGADLLRSMLPSGAAVLALGGAGVVQALTDAGLRPVAPSDPAGSGESVTAVLQGLGPDLTVRDFQSAARVLATDVHWVATNTDSTLPLPWGMAPGNGAYVALLQTAVDRSPEVVGKPFAPLYLLARDHLGTAHERTLAVGDRLGTDIAGAEAAGIDSAWVLTGVDRPSALMRTTLSPTYVMGSLGELLEPYAAPVRRGAAWECGAATARLDSDRLRVDLGGAPPISGVRAGLAALVAARDGDGAPADRLASMAGTLDDLQEAGR